MFVSYKNQFLCSLLSLSFFLIWLFSLRHYFVCLFFIIFLVCTFVWVWLCICLWFYSLLKAPPFPKYIFIIHQKPIFPFFLLSRLHTFSAIFRFTCLAKRSKSYRWNWSLFVCLWFVLLCLSVANSDGNAFSRRNKPFNWLILLVLFIWLENPWFRLMCRNYSKKGSLKNWLKNFDTCELLLCSTLLIADQI